jgi:hypothetical protein
MDGVALEMKRAAPTAPASIETRFKGDGTTVCLGQCKNYNPSHKWPTQKNSEHVNDWMIDFTVSL